MQTHLCFLSSIFIVSKSNTNLDIVFVLDSSDSVDQDTWLKMKQYVLKMTSTMKVSPQDDRIGLLNAGQTTTPIVKLSEGTSQSTITEKLSEASKQQGNLDLDSAIRETGNLFDQQRNYNNYKVSPKVAVLVTKSDAETIDAAKMEKYISELKSKDVILKVIHISDKQDQDQGDKGAESSKDAGNKVVVVVKNANQLPSTISDISKTIVDASGMYNIQRKEFLYIYF